MGPRAAPWRSFFALAFTFALLSTFASVARADGDATPPRPRSAYDPGTGFGTLGVRFGASWLSSPPTLDIYRTTAKGHPTGSKLGSISADGDAFVGPDLGVEVHVQSKSGLLIQLLSLDIGIGPPAPYPRQTAVTYRDHPSTFQADIAASAALGLPGIGGHVGGDGSADFAVLVHPSIYWLTISGNVDDYGYHDDAKATWTAFSMNADATVCFAGHPHACIGASPAFYPAGLRVGGLLTLGVAFDHPGRP